MSSADFIWGVATSAYQIEGGRTASKGESIWDRFAHAPGRVVDGSTGDIACDHYHRWREDIALMAELGVDAYRFSIAWSRLIPDGTGIPSTEGMAFYDGLVDELLANGITPLPTLYHWDLPQALQDRGGWQDRGTVDAFAEYAHVATDALGDRVDSWITHNEPWVAAFLGHLEGVHAPGLQNWGAALAAGHHILLSHGRAARSILSSSPATRVGVALDCRPSHPATPSEADIAAQKHFDGFRNRWFFDPVFGKGYPEDVLDAYRAAGRIGGEVGFVRPGDLDEIAAPLDFLGLNYYTSIAVGAGSEESEEPAIEPGPNPPPGFTEMGWESTPAALTEFLARIDEDYSPRRVLITENGASYSDGPAPDGSVHDERRISYLDDHITAVAKARDLGLPVDGYFAWSLLDNFEWALGFTQRFGIVWVDFRSGERIPKDSYYWYRDRIAAGI